VAFQCVRLMVDNETEKELPAIERGNQRGRWVPGCLRARTERDVANRSTQGRKRIRRTIKKSTQRRYHSGGGNLGKGGARKKGRGWGETSGHQKKKTVKSAKGSGKKR